MIDQYVLPPDTEERCALARKHVEGMRAKALRDQDMDMVADLDKVLAGSDDKVAKYWETWIIETEKQRGNWVAEMPRCVSREESSETEVNREGRYHDDFLDMDFECFKTACDVRDAAMTTQSGIIEKFMDSDGTVYTVDTKTRRGRVSISKDGELVYIQPRYLSYTQKKMGSPYVKPYYWSCGLKADFDKGVVRMIDPRFGYVPTIPSHPMICKSVKIVGKEAVFDYWYRGDYHNQRFVTTSKAIVRQVTKWELDKLTASGVLVEIDITAEYPRSECPYPYYKLKYIARRYPAGKQSNTVHSEA